RLDQLIQDVLSYTKILRVTTPLQALDLDRLARDMIATYPDWLPPRADVVIEGTLPTVSGNEAFLTQCFSNLVGNAVKFQPAGNYPRVRIRAEPCEDEVRVWIEDNGIGIAPENHRRIFGLFEQVNAPSDYEGTGVGLTIVRKAVERMNGRYGFESALGQGSRFWFQLKSATPS
ncbi:MAG TPA: ATP-binding protein, partial [Roseimicrobium sp.]|nr:ATP-binding protein [Roseimicrobium sp.]